MKIKIPSANYVPDYNDGAPLFPEIWFTLNAWLTQAQLQAASPSVVGDDSYFQNGVNEFDPNKESLNDIHQADGIITEHPMVWECDRGIFELPMPTSIPASRIPTGAVDHFSNINKFTEEGSAVKTVGEWIDSLCIVFNNAVTGRVQIYSNPINNTFIEYHLVKAFASEFTVENHGSLENDSEFLIISQAESRRNNDSNWLILQP